MVFGCISKNFPKNIFWCLEKKKENTNPEKHKPQPRSRRPTTAPSIAIQDRNHDLAFFTRSRLTARSREASTVISIRCDLSKARSRRQRSRSGAISRRWDRDLDPVARSRSTTTGMFAGEITIGADWRSRSRVRSLSLSHFPEILWREIRSVKWFPWSKAFFFYQRISISGK